MKLKIKITKKDWKKILILEGLIIILLLTILTSENFWLLSDKYSQINLPKLKSLPLKTVINSKTPTINAASPSATPAKVTFNTPVNFGRSVRVPILMYHYIGGNPNPADLTRNILSTTPDKFDEQMGYLASRGYTPITFDTMYAALYHGSALPAKPIILTFDDGYIDFYINAFPILKKYNFHAVSFIPTGLIGGSYYMNWSQIQELQASGLISFEAHTINHVNLPLLSAEKQQYQITKSKRDLEAHLGVPVNFFAYPYGTSNASTWNLVKQAGFLGAVGTWYGTTETEGTQYDWPRIRINGGITLTDFAKKF